MHRHEVELARGTLRGKLPQLQEALEGRIQPHHRMLLQQIFAPLQFLESSMQQILKEIEAQMDPYQEVVVLLMTHPGVQAVAAMGVVSEVGIDLSRFPSAKHFASWIGVCPGNHTSTGKRKHGKTTKANAILRYLCA